MLYRSQYITHPQLAFETCDLPIHLPLNAGQFHLSAFVENLTALLLKGHDWLGIQKGDLQHVFLKVYREDG